MAVCSFTTTPVFDALPPYPDNTHPGGACDRVNPSDKFLINPNYFTAFDFIPGKANMPPTIMNIAGG